MNTLIYESLAKSVTFKKSSMIVELTDGRKLSVPLVFFPRLLNATNKQRENYVISGGGVGLHWDKLDEDINVKNLLLGMGDRTRFHEENIAV